MVTRFRAADSAAAANNGFALKLVDRAMSEGTVLGEPRKNLREKGSEIENEEVDNSENGNESGRE